MRRAFFACLACLSATVALAANPYFLDRTGTLWTASASLQGLLLTGEKDGVQLVQSVVPFPLSMPGTNDANFQVAADELTGKVVVVWQRNWPSQASQIMVAIWNNGDWERVESLSQDLMANPRNPTIQLSEFAATEPNPDAPDDPSQAIVVQDSYLHVVWWEGTDNGHGTYALLRLTADVSDTDALSEQNLDYVTLFGFGCTTPMPPSVLEHPVFASQTTRDRALLLFGSQRLCFFQLLQVTFTVDQTPGVLQRRRSVPIFGVASVFPMARDMSMDGTRVLLGADLNPVAYRVVDATTLQYMNFSNGQWSPVRTLTVTSALTMDQAIPLIENLAR